LTRQAGQLQLRLDHVSAPGRVLARALPQWERHVVLQLQRAEERGALEQDAEQLADLVQLLGRALEDVRAVDDDLSLLRTEQTDQGLQEDRLAGTRRPQKGAHLAIRKGERDVLPDLL